MIQEITAINVNVEALWNFIFASKQFKEYFTNVEHESKKTLELDNTKIPEFMGLDVNIHVSTEYKDDDPVYTLNMFNVQIWNHHNNMIEISNYKELYDYAEAQIKSF